MAPAKGIVAEGSFACHVMSKIELSQSRLNAACANLSVGGLAILDELQISNGSSSIITI
jgi:hypothetical protein